MSESLKDRLARLKGEKKSPIEKLKKAEKSKKGGKRSGSGRKPKESTLITRGIKAYLDQHINENVKIKVTDPKTGKSREIKKPRLVVVLERLFEAAVTDKNVDAMNKWLDRALGKPLQKIGGDDNQPLKLEIDIGPMLEKAYGNKLTE